MSQTISERVAETVRAEAARRRVPQRKIAEALGTSQQSVSRRMSGHTPFDVAEIYSLAEVLGINVSILLPDIDSQALAGQVRAGS